MLVASLLVSCAVLALTSGQASNVQPRYPLTYPYGEGLCSRLPSSHTCCVDRRDDCSTPISTTRCYCDSFCNKHGPNRDCCEDYESFCEGRGTDPGHGVHDNCPYDGKNHALGARVQLRDNCYSCICKKVSDGRYELQCDYECSPKPPGVCPYSDINYPAEDYVDIRDGCYSCTCQRSLYDHVRMNCLYLCTPTLPPTGYVCQHDNRFWRENESVRENCRICTCQKGANGVFGVSCYEDPSCEPEGCSYNSQVYRVGSLIRIGLQECTCTALADSVVQFICTDPHPTDLKDILSRINSGSYGWTAYRYTFLVDHTMEEVFRLRTGVCRPETQAIHDPHFSEGAHGTIIFQLDAFDARTQWPGLIRPISDAGNHPVSWAITIADLVADRKAIRSLGYENLPLSAQNLVSCVRHPDSHCTSTSKGWEYLSNFGILSEQCYPRNSHGASVCREDIGEDYLLLSCPSGTGYPTVVRMSRAHRISTDEKFIRMEIDNYGPVQAHIRVREDFFYYRSGVYKHVFGNLLNNREYYLAVRIIGWGTDLATGSPINYWICANSWGTDWGENGHFRILRGDNECQIEEYVYAV